MPIYETIVALTKARGMNIAQLEAEARLTAKSVSKWKTSIPSADKLFAVSKVLGVTMEELLTGNVVSKPTLQLSAEEEDLVNWYREADVNDRQIIQAVLNRYRKDTHLANSDTYRRSG